MTDRKYNNRRVNVTASARFPLWSACTWERVKRSVVRQTQMARMKRVRNVKKKKNHVDDSLFKTWRDGRKN